jgi:hypothetical protein
MDPEESAVMYMYYRDGKQLLTPNEQIAIQRSDTGEYFKITRTSEEVDTKNM